MSDFRCDCGKLLATVSDNMTTIPNEILLNISDNMREIDKDSTEIEIKCPRCGKINKLIV